MNSTLHCTDYRKDLVLEEELRENSLELAVSRVTMRAIMFMAALVGVWGLACLFAGLIGAEGLAGLWQGWLGAVTGS